MILYASATPAGAELITDSGAHHYTVYGSDFNVGIATKIVTPANIPDDNWTAASFIILTDSDKRIVEKAIADVLSRKKVATNARVAIAIQKIERANQNNTSKPKSYGEYDGSDLKEVARYEYAEGRMVTNEEPVSVSTREVRGSRIPLHHRHKGSLHSTHSQAVTTMMKAVEEYETPRVWYAADANIDWKHME